MNEKIHPKNSSTCTLHRRDRWMKIFIDFFYTSRCVTVVSSSTPHTAWFLLRISVFAASAMAVSSSLSAALVPSLVACAHSSRESTGSSSVQMNSFARGEILGNRLNVSSVNAAARNSVLTSSAPPRRLTTCKVWTNYAHHSLFFTVKFWAIQLVKRYGMNAGNEFEW